MLAEMTATERWLGLATVVGTGLAVLSWLDVKPRWFGFVLGAIEVPAALLGVLPIVGVMASWVYLRRLERGTSLSPSADMETPLVKARASDGAGLRLVGYVVFPQPGTIGSPRGWLEVSSSRTYDDVHVFTSGPITMAMGAEDTEGTRAFPLGRVDMNSKQQIRLVGANPDDQLPLSVTFSEKGVNGSFEKRITLTPLGGGV